MGYTASDIGVGARANIKILRWNAETGETYPETFDDRYRLIRLMTIVMFKSTIVSTALARIAILRQGFPTETRIWQRFYQTAEQTGDPTLLQAQEQVSDNLQTIIPSVQIIGTGLIMPPRSQLETFMTTTTAFDFRLDILMVEADDPADLSQFL